MKKTKKKIMHIIAHHFSTWMEHVLFLSQQHTKFVEKITKIISTDPRVLFIFHSHNIAQCHRIPFVGIYRSLLRNKEKNNSEKNIKN